MMVYATTGTGNIKFRELLHGFQCKVKTSTRRNLEGVVTWQLSQQPKVYTNLLFHLVPVKYAYIDAVKSASTYFTHTYVESS